MIDPNRLELEQERKRVRSLVKSTAGRAALEQELGIKFAYTDEKDNRPLIAVLIPSHRTPAPQTGQALNAMIAATKDIAHITVPPYVSSSVVHWVRNQCLVNLNKLKLPYTHVLFMDDDIVPHPETLKALLSRNAGVVASVCTVRQDPPMPNARYFNQELMIFQTADIDKPGIYKVGAIGTGLMLIRRDVLDRVAEYTINCEYEKKSFEWPDHVIKRVSEGRRKKYEEGGDAFWFKFLDHPNGDGEYGEDISFCLKAKECGYEIYGDATTEVGHVGDYAYSLKDYWSYRPEVVAQGKVVSVVPEKQDSDIILVE